MFVVYFAGTAFEDGIYLWNCFNRCLPMLKCARKFVVSIASTKLTSMAWFTLDMAFGTAAPVETCSMIDGYGMERTIDGKQRNGNPKNRINKNRN